MSFRTLIRIAALALGLTIAAPLLWPTIDLWALLPGPGLVIAAIIYLGITSSSGKTSRWQIRYWLDRQQPNERLAATLNFLAERAGHITLEANSQGIFLETPPAFDRYMDAQLQRTLPEAKIRQVGTKTAAPNAFLLAANPPSNYSQILHWATESPGRQVRLHIRRGLHITLIAQAENGSRPPGNWIATLAPKFLKRQMWRRLPLWDELAADTNLDYLLPVTDSDAIYSSRSRLLRPTASTIQVSKGRRLGQTLDAQDVYLDYNAPLLTTGAPDHFLIQQAIQDIRAGQSVVIISPHRRVLNQIQRQAQTTTHWLDQENARVSPHLAIVDAPEWPQRNVQSTIEYTRQFLIDLGLDLRLSVVQTTIEQIIYILAASAQKTGHDFTFIDLYAISQNTQALKAFLADLLDLAAKLNGETLDNIRCLLTQLDSSVGYIQTTAILSTIRSALSPIRSGALHTLYQPPFLNIDQALLSSGHLLLVPLTNTDFPQHDRFLAATLNLALRQSLTGNPSSTIALHLHDPHSYFQDSGQQWLDLAREKAYISLLLDTRNPGDYYHQGQPTDGELVFCCDNDLAAFLADDWRLKYTALELTEIPTNTALAQLPSQPGPLTIKVDAP